MSSNIHDQSTRESQHGIRAIELPVGGITSYCGICGCEISTDPESIKIGLNGVLCQHCSLNLNLFTPRWASITTVSGTFDLWSYPCYPESPYWDASTNVVFVEGFSNGLTDAHRLHNWINSRSEETLELIYYISSDQIPPGYEIITSEELHTDIYDYRSYGETEEDNRFEEARRFLPRPFVVDSGRIIAQFQEDGNVRKQDIESVVTSGASSSNLGQSSIGSYSGDAGEGSPSDGRPKAGGSDTQQSPTEQSGLGNYT